MSHRSVLILDVFYNRPPLCVNATWNQTGSTTAYYSILRAEPWSIFIDSEDTIYFADRTNRQILIWSRNNVSVLSHVSLSMYCPLFVTSNRDIYYAYGFRGGRVMRQSVSESQPAPVAIFQSECYGLFIDRTKTLYCSVKDEHHVATTSLYGDRQVSTMRAGTGTNGSAANQLSSPWGIFVDIDLSLYVADTGNHRIQRFLPNQSNGSTLAGNNIPCGLQLNYPTDVVVDGSGFIFIADSRNHRVIRVGTSGYRCVAGCQSQPGSSANQLNQPSLLRLNSAGNVFVVDKNNGRLQKFIVNGKCNRTYDFAVFLCSKMRWSVILETIGANVSMSCPMTSTAATMTEFITSSMVTTVTSQPHACSSPWQTGSFCNSTSTPCSVLTPCQNNGSCFDVTNDTRGYSCSCQSGFGGDHCEVDLRPCGTNPCLYNGQSSFSESLSLSLIRFVLGTCQTLPNGTALCRCALGREGSRCERRTDFCGDVKCENDGVCQSRSTAYQCLCVSDSYSGVYCEIESGKIRMYRISALTIACVSIAMIVACATFVVVMDILKYVFGIDAPKVEEPKKKQKRRRKQRKYAVAIHYRYIS